MDSGIEPMRMHAFVNDVGCNHPDRPGRGRDCGNCRTSFLVQHLNYYNRLAARRKVQAPTPEISAETCHSFAAAASFCASFKGVAGLDLSKYLPLTPSTSGEVAR